MLPSAASLPKDQNIQAGRQARTRHGDALPHSADSRYVIGFRLSHAHTAADLRGQRLTNHP